GKDSVDLLKRLLDRFGDRLRYVLVLNQIRGDDFGILKQSGELERATAVGAKLVSLKHLHDSVINKIDASSSSFWAAKNASDKEATGLGMMDRQRVKMWLRDAYQEIDAAGV
ncbi:MAG TPA: mobilization protein, partial [Verrucomicrobiae bacterium]|nr:mobilization protein [Verrucomicrobiae bacterium]